MQLTLLDIKRAVSSLERRAVKPEGGYYVLRIHPSRTEEAFDLGLSPFCPIEDSEVVENILD